MTQVRWRSLMGVWLLTLGLAGCDIPGSQHLSDPVLGGPSDGELEEADQENIVAYFYAGRPVSGLLYVCTLGGVQQHVGGTDSNGRFICPRTATVSFFVGKRDLPTLKLGEVPLNIFGSASAPNLRNFVAITPSSLYGGAVDANHEAVVNIFNLLESLDSLREAAPTYKQPTIEITLELLDSVLQTPEFSALRTLSITGPNNTFAARLQDLLDAVVAARGSSASPVSALTPSEASDLARVALRREHEGLYRTTSATADLDDFGSGTPTVYLLSAQYLVGNDGVTAGYAFSQEVSSSSSGTTNLIHRLPLRAGARVATDGTLLDFLFGDPAREVELTGALVNNALWSSGRLCQADSPNEQVPTLYCDRRDQPDGFSPFDAGLYASVLGYDEGINIPRAVDWLPDVDLDFLPDNYLPRTFTMTLSRYDNVDYADLTNADYDETEDDKAAFGNLDELTEKLRYTLLPSGDIVSDLDGDCATVRPVGGVYLDTNGDSREYLIGRIGNAYRADLPDTASDVTDDSIFLTLQFIILDEAHPYYGLSIGFPAQFRSGLFPVSMLVMEGDTIQEHGPLLSKKCAVEGALASCTAVAEWFNDVEFLDKVHAPDQAVVETTPPLVPDSTNFRYENEVYYGQLAGNLRDTTGIGVCPPPTPVPPPP